MAIVPKPLTYSSTKPTQAKAMPWQPIQAPAVPTPTPSTANTTQQTTVPSTTTIPAPSTSFNPNDALNNNFDPTLFNPKNRLQYSQAVEQLKTNWKPGQDNSWTEQARKLLDENATKSSIDMSGLGSDATLEQVRGIREDLARGQVPNGPTVPAPRNGNGNNTLGTMTPDQIKAQADAEIARLVQEKTRVANQTKAGIQQSYDRQQALEKDNRALQDNQFSRLNNPYSGGTDFRKGLLERERGITDRQQSEDLQTRMASVDMQLSDYINATPAEREKMINELTARERQAALANQQENFNEAATTGQLTGNFLHPEAQQAIQAILTAKQQNSNGGNFAASQAANQARAYLASIGIDSNLFGADVTYEQASANAGRAGIPTLQGRQQNLNESSQVLKDAWTQADMLGYVTPALSRLTGIPQGTPTLQAKQIAIQQQNANTSSGQLGLEQYKFNYTKDKPTGTAGKNDAMGQIVNDIQYGMSSDARKKFFTEKKADLIKEFGVSGYNQLYDMFFDKNGDPVNPSEPSGVTPQSTAGLINNAARSHGISPKLLSAVAMQESGMGQASNNVMQVNGMDNSSPEQSINVGSQMLADLFERTGGSVEWTLAAYNMGPGILDFARSHGITDPRVAMQEFQKYQMANGYSGGYGDAQYIDHVARYL